jgi:hypothetical protein
MSLLQSVRSINTRMAACFGTYSPGVKGTSMSSVVQTSSGGISGSSGTNTNGSGFGGFGAGGNGFGSGDGGGGGGGNLITYYVADLATIIEIIVRIKAHKTITGEIIPPMNEKELHAKLEFLVSLQLKLSNTYTKSVDPTADYKTIYTNILTTDIFIYILYFAYNFCDFQLTQYQLIRGINNYQARYLQALKNNQENNANTSFTQHTISLAINTSIKTEYLDYIKYYGIPKKGYFVPSILERLHTKIINNTNYEMFKPDALDLVDPIDQNWVLPTTINSLTASHQSINSTFIDPQTKKVVNESVTTNQVPGLDGKIHYTTNILETDELGNVLTNISIYV